MKRLQFRVLYREFLFRMVDLELLSAHAQGDTLRLLGQFAALLVFTSLGFAYEGLVYGSLTLSPSSLLVSGWRTEHGLIATTMLVVGLFAVLSWDSTFPDRRDVLVLAPLPVRARTMFLAKVAALATSLTLTVGLLHVLAGLVWPLAIYAQSSPMTAPIAGSDAALPPLGAADLQAVLDRDVGESEHPPDWGASIGVVKHGVRRVFSYGAARPDSVYEIGHITRAFTSAVLARMAVEGKVRLDQSVREMLQETGFVSAAWRPVTLLDLATEQGSLGGLPDNLPPTSASNNRQDYGTTDLREYAHRRGLIKPPGDHYQESHWGVAVLGQLLAEREGESYDDLAADTITRPLGMHDTAVALTPELQSRLIPGHKGEGRFIRAWGYSAFGPAMGIHSTAGDVLTFLEANLHPERVAGPLGKALAWTQEARADIAPGMRIGLGWKLRIADGTWFQEGSTNEYSGYAFFNPRWDTAAIVLLNNGQSVASSAGRLAEHISQRLNGEPARSLANAHISAPRGFPAIVRLFFAYWVTMFAAGSFIFGAMLTAQGLAAQLPRRFFLRLSSFLQLAAFCTFLAVYFLQPPLGDPFSARWDGRVFGRLPSYWFLGLFHWLNGSMHPALAPLAHRALAAWAVAAAGSGGAFLVSYFRTIRKIVEEPDLVPGARGWNWLPRFGNSLETAIVQFSIRTLLRSRLHRVILAFYLGIGFALTIVLVKSPGPQLATAVATSPWRQVSIPLLASSLLMLGFWIVGTRVVFAMPIDLRANWIFRVTPVRGGRACLAARRRSLTILAATPALAGSALLFLSLWPILPAVGHLAVLAMVGAIVIELSLGGIQKIPFTCSYLPAKTNFHPFWIFIGLLIPIAMGCGALERPALESPRMLAAVLAGLAIVALLVRWWRTPETWEDVPVEFEEVPPNHILVLGLARDGGRPMELAAGGGDGGGSVVSP